MCLGVPMQVVKVEGMSAVVEFEGTSLEVRLDIVDRRPEVGEYVIVHAGYAIHWIDEAEAKETLEYFRLISEAMDEEAARPRRRTKRK
jgi:hydrogenase expression/formation protein HypC